MKIIEEIITDFISPDNGSSALWCYGSPTIVRDSSKVFATVQDTGKDVKPYCNTRLQLFCREDGGKWERIYVNDTYNEREPLPMGVLEGNRVLVSANPAKERASIKRIQDGQTWICEPQILEFDSNNLEKEPQILKPVWKDEKRFTSHTYRAIGVDPKNSEILLIHLNNMRSSNDEYCCSLYDESGNWNSIKGLQFPVRGCYLQVMLRNRAANILAISDIVEPNEKWREFKFNHTGRKWDYDFRNLYYTHTDDITKGFGETMVVASREETAGHIQNLDLWIDDDGDAHIVYADRNIWYPFMRDEFFPDMKLEVSLEYCRIKGDKIVERRTIDRGVETKDGTVPSYYGTFHTNADGELRLIYYKGTKNLEGKILGGENFITKIYPDTDKKPTPLNLEYPLETFFAATVRNGTKPSNIIDIFGQYGTMQADKIRYLQIDLDDLITEGI